MVTDGPLSGTTVVDLTRFVAGSFATMTLASLGAEVIKIEVPPHGDSYRSQGAVPTADGSVLFESLNRGKKSVALDFRQPDGAEALDALLSGSDFFVHNARPGTIDRHGLGFASIHEAHPWIIYAAISAFGDVGPDAGRGGFDLIVQAESGMMALTGSEQSGPVKMGAPLLDIGAGLAAVAGILAAHEQRHRTGEGTEVSSSLFEFALAAFTTLAGDVLVTGESPEPLGSHSSSFAPYGGFRALDGQFVLAGAGSEHLWIELCRVLDRGDLVEDPRFVDNAARLRNRDALTEELERTLRLESVSTWLERLERAGIPAGKIRTLEEVLRSPQTEALDIVRRSKGASDSSPAAIDLPFRLGGRRPTLASAPPLGADTRFVLERAGLGADLVQRLCTALGAERS